MLRAVPATRRIALVTVKQFNARTQDKAGKVLPVVITYYNDKSFTFVVKTPPVAIQLLEAAKKKSGSAQPNRTKIAEITWDQVKAIAEDKMPDLNCLQKSIMLIPFEPRAGPTGGEGFAAPPLICNLINPATSLAIVID